jgi:hypothetical protein
MDELKAEALEVLSELDERQLGAVLTYARSLRGDDEIPVVDIEELLDQPS